MREETALAFNKFGSDKYDEIIPVVVARLHQGAVSSLFIFEISTGQNSLPFILEALFAKLNYDLLISLTELLPCTTV